MSEQKISAFQRIINLFVGLINLGLAFVVAIEISTTLSILVNLLAIVVVLSGILRIYNAFFDKDLKGIVRVFRFLFGSISVLIGLGIFLIADLGIDLLVLMLAIGLLVQGISRVLVGFTLKGLPKWLKFLFILFGLTTIVIASYVMVYTDVAVLTLILLLSYGFLLNGFNRILVGITGYKTEKDKPKDK